LAAVRIGCAEIRRLYGKSAMAAALSEAKSGQQFFDHVPVNIRQPEISSLKTVDQFCVIESEQM
jgi:hypothetical protein